MNISVAVSEYCAVLWAAQTVFKQRSIISACEHVLSQFTCGKVFAVFSSSSSLYTAYKTICHWKTQLLRPATMPPETTLSKRRHRRTTIFSKIPAEKRAAGTPFSRTFFFRQNVGERHIINSYNLRNNRSLPPRRTPRHHSNTFFTARRLLPAPIL